jgi:tetratricopeptide (TPR) repeat protein
MAMISKARERYAEAEPLAKRALDSRRKLKGNHHVAVADAMVTLSDSYLGQGKLEDAERLLKDALAIDERVNGADSGEVAASLTRLATIDRKLGRVNDSQAKLKRALAIRERRVQDHPDVAQCLKELGDLDQARGNSALAEAAFLRALSIWEKAGLSEHPQVAKILESDAKLIRGLGRSDEAREMEARAQAIRARQNAEFSGK